MDNSKLQTRMSSNFKAEPVEAGDGSDPSLSLGLFLPFVVFLPLPALKTRFAGLMFLCAMFARYNFAKIDTSLMMSDNNSCSVYMTRFYVSNLMILTIPVVNSETPSSI